MSASFRASEPTDPPSAEHGKTIAEGKGLGQAVADDQYREIAVPQAPEQGVEFLTLLLRLACGGFIKYQTSWFGQ
jgi:hypothetical protein